jgi:hypothetical protein
MRIVNGILCLVLILFAVSQYNDPDGVFWTAVYLVAAVWCGVAALRPGQMAVPAVRVVYGLSLAAAVAGVVVFWPDASRWWMQEVWWETETAREGMGFMIILAALLVAGTAILRRRA